MPLSQRVLGDLKSFSDLNHFLAFEQKQTTAPERLKNPAGHYRSTVQKFYQTRAKKRDWDTRQQMRALEARIGSAASSKSTEPTACTLSTCGGTGECWDEAGFVSACGCQLGQQLSPKVFTAFEELNSARRALLQPGNPDIAARQLSPGMELVE